jgi:hypothetical protein
MWRMQAAVDCGSWELFFSEAKQPVQYFFPMAAIGISYTSSKNASPAGERKVMAGKGFQGKVCVACRLKSKFVGSAKLSGVGGMGKPAMLCLRA